jgi:hypothetical protein
VARITVGSSNSSSTRRSRFVKLAALAAMVLFGTALLPPGVSGAATAVGLGSAESFAVLGATTVTNTGPSVVNGDLGVHAGTAITGFDLPGGPGVVNGEIHAGDAVALAAQSAASTAYDALSAQDCDEVLDSAELGGRELVPGVYCLESAAQLTGALTLDAGGDPDAVFIIRIATALTTASDSSVVFLDAFETCNVFWQVGSAATLGTGTDFVGTLIAETETIAVDNGASVSGRLLALVAAVTLDNNVITTPTCTFVDTTPIVIAPIVVPPVVTTTTTTATTTPVDTDDTTVDTVVVPEVGGPSVPRLTASPGTPATPNRPALPYTGSNLVPVGFAMLAITAGGALILASRTSRMVARRSSRS